MELGPNQLKAVEALESGKFERGVGMLCQNNKYCCLGVFSELFATEKFKLEPTKNYNEETVYYRDYEGYYNVAPPSVCKALALYGELGECKNDGDKDLWILNDNIEMSFKDIAKVIRDNPEQYFMESK